MAEYLRAADVKITERVATALFYGIKTDTLHLERSGTRADMQAFAYLYGLANHNILRRIERPELPLDALDALGDALVHRTIIQNALFAHLGPVSRPDLIPQFADLCLQVKGIEWSVVSGPDGRRGAHLGPQRRLRPGGRGRRADRVRRPRLGRRPPFGREGGDPGEPPGPPASVPSRPPRCAAPSSPASSTLSTGAPPPPKSASRATSFRASGDMLAARRGGGASGGLGGSGRCARLTVRGPRAEDDERDNAPQVGGSPRGRILALIPLATPAYALSACGGGSRAGGLAQLPGGRPLADPIPHIPINGTAGFVVPGANSCPAGTSRSASVTSASSPSASRKKGSSTRTPSSSPSATASPSGSSSRSRCPTPGTRRTSRTSTAAASTI